MKNILRTLKALHNDESGQDLIEYALVAALIALGAVTTIGSLATDINLAFSTIGYQDVQRYRVVGRVRQWHDPGGFSGAEAPSSPGGASFESDAVWRIGPRGVPLSDWVECGLGGFDCATLRNTHFCDDMAAGIARLQNARLRQ